MRSGTFTTRQIISIMAIAVVGGCIPALQPLLLGGMLLEGKLSAVQIGQAAMLEGLGMAIAAILAGAFLKPLHLKKTIVVAALVAMTANILTTMLDPLGILAARAINGACSGVLLWLIVGMFARLAAPARAFAIYATAQAGVAFILSALYSAYIVPSFGIGGSYLLLAGLNLLLLIPVIGIPRAFSLLGSAKSALRPTLPGTAGLVTVLLYLAGIMAFWVYIIPIGREGGFHEGSLSFLISLAIAVQILGGLAASIVAPRINATTATIVTALVCAAMVYLASTATNILTLYAAVSVFAFCWMFAPPFHMPFLIRLDPSRQSAMFVSSAQLIGVSVGPLLSATLVTSESFEGAATASIVVFLLSAGLAFISVRIFFGDRVAKVMTDSSL